MQKQQRAIHLRQGYGGLKAGMKPDPTGQGMSEKYFKGPLHIQLRSALDYIRNYILKEKVFKVSGRAEAERHWNYPYDAVEEALVNAVYHKSYRKPEPIVVTFTREQMTITSIPGPDRSIKTADIKRLRLVSKGDRNRRIGEFLKEFDLAEARNTGYRLSSVRPRRTDRPSRCWRRKPMVITSRLYCRSMRCS